MAEILNVNIQNDTSELHRVIDAVKGFSDAQNWEEGLSLRVQLMLEELVGNIISYGYPDEALHEIHIRVMSDSNAISIVIEDDALPFDPLMLAEPDLTAEVEERESGGLGIHLVRNLVDDIVYERQDGKNILSLHKKRQSVT